MGDSITVMTPSTSSGAETPKKRAISEVTTDAPPSTIEVRPTGGHPVRKRTKVTEAEKEEKRKEKEAKEEEKRKEKEAKEEEKRKEKEAKEEEKRKEKEVRDKEKEAKKAEREEKKRIKDEEKRKKEEEKRKKEEEKERKNRAQVRLDAFFAAPVTPKKDPSAAAASRSNFSQSPSSAEKPFSTRHPLKSEPQKGSYYDEFRAFYIKQNMAVAPPHAFERDEKARLVMCRTLDEVLSLPEGKREDSMDVDDTVVAETKGITKEEIAELLHIPSNKARSRRGNVLAYSTKDILARIENPDDPGLSPLRTGCIKPKAYNSAYYLKLLNELPNKFLRFAEDVRPPYSGTYTKNPVSSGLRKGRKPFDRALPGVNYDYDSEVEWVADEEGEELLSEDEEDKESEGGDSLDGFLDDEEDVGLKRGGMAVLIPTNSGMCWEDDSGKTIRPDLEELRMGVLIESITTPIDPFSTKYWEPQPPAEPTTRPKTFFTSMEPPRKPLASTNRILLAVAGTAATPGKKDATTKKLVPPEFMEDFKRAIDGSDMTKAGLIEVLKKTFPKIGKDHIKNTLDLVADRVGEKRDDKRWVLK
ncbi:chromatin assembly factor 1 subunit A-domain-containing protein [Trichophaea hybrida]|nr:chromatin assembly factor 1 subunit A-domain-containing protein [Trichophaea hybrida]